MNIQGFDGKTGKEWVKERKHWGQTIKAGYPDKFVHNASNQHDEIFQFMLEFESDAAPAAEAAPAKKEESEEEEDDDMGFGLFD